MICSGMYTAIVPLMHLFCGCISTPLYLPKLSFGGALRVSCASCRFMLPVTYLLKSLFRWWTLVDLSPLVIYQAYIKVMA
ncbi:hypothetical protein Barb4_03818 [Bacteroidales bacterium Barb4]|nr:hypothetical protein Barb4_05150 [Bacteroidales bacterium Barb4]OAV64838.1 hypothetical protein Barb4_03818 [Bacteroidales bacterium Barb4]